MPQFLFIFLLFALQLCSASFFSSYSSVTPPDPGGVDISSPQHHYLDVATWQGQRYKTFIEGCYAAHGKAACDSTEIARINQNFQQPKGEHNYTEVGFRKLRVPDHVWEIVSEFWEANKMKETNEKWPPGNTYTNNWLSPTYMVSLENRKLRGGDGSTKKKIWDGMRPILEEWVGHRLVETSLYGIRIYKDGAILSSHVDRLPLVTSCIIHVDSDIDEPWPIEVISHDGKAHNVTMKPGEMVLYESHTVIHGRPTALKGRFYANLFVHFAPVDHEQMNEDDKKMIVKGNGIGSTDKLHDATFTTDKYGNDRSEKFKKGFDDHKIASNSRIISGHEQANHDNGDIDRIKRDFSDHLEKPGADLSHVLHSSRAANDRSPDPAPAPDDKEDLAMIAKGTMAANTFQGSGSKGPNVPWPRGASKGGREDQDQQPDEDEEEGRLYKFLPLNEAAARGDSKVLKALIKEFPNTVTRKDVNGWTALHEASRAGQTDAVKLLVESGAKLHATTNSGETPHWWAKRSLPQGHDILEYFLTIDAPEMGGL